MVTITAPLMREIMDALTGAGGPLEGLKVRLLSDNTPIGPQTKWADLVEAGFDGYAGSATIAFGAAFSDPVGNGVVAGTRIQFSCTGDTHPETVYGWALTSGTSTITLVCGENLPSPVPVAKAGDAVIIVPMVGLPGPVAGLVAGP